MWDAMNGGGLVYTVLTVLSKSTMIAYIFRVTRMIKWMATGHHVHACTWSARDWFQGQVLSAPAKLCLFLGSFIYVITDWSTLVSSGLTNFKERSGYLFAHTDLWCTRKRQFGKHGGCFSLTLIWLSQISLVYKITVHALWSNEWQE